MSQRPLLKATLAAGLLMLLAAVALVWFGPSTPSASTSASAPPSASPAPTSSGVLTPSAGAQQLPGDPKPAAELLPMPGCWDGLLAFDASASLDTFRPALAAAVGARDRILAGYLQERLTELVGEDAERALTVLQWAEKSSQPELGVYMEALKAAPAVHHPRVADALLRMGEDKGAPLQNRAAALDTLETQKRFTPDMRQRIKAIALDESLDSVSWVATRTLGRVMKEDFERTGTFAPYWKDLLDVSEKSDDMAVRLLALEMPSYSNPVIGGDSYARLEKILLSDSERDVREMAAFRLAVSEEPQKAMDVYRKAFAAEQDLCVRWAIFRFAVRAAGPQALPQLQQWASADPRFQQDYQDFQQLYADGTTDFARIWLGKKEHHNCLMEEGAPH